GLPEAQYQAGRASRGSWCVGRACLRPRYVGRARPVAGLARHHDLGPLCGITILSGVVVPAQIGRVALRALIVPGLLPSCPVQWVRWPECLARIEVEPALAACLLWARVPGDRQRLQAAAWKFDQILLQGRDSESVLNFVVVQLTVGTVGVDVEPPVAREKGRGDPSCSEMGIVKIPEHSLRIRFLHRQSMVRAVPCLIHLGMARGTRPAANVVRRGRADGGWRGGGRARRRGPGQGPSGPQTAKEKK